MVVEEGCRYPSVFIGRQKELGCTCVIHYITAERKRNIETCRILLPVPVVGLGRVSLGSRAALRCL